MYTPWGTADSVHRYSDGIAFVSTSSHGGFKVPAKLNRRIPPPLRKGDGWYEEDCEWAIVALFHPDSPAFGSDGKSRDDVCRDARRLVKEYFPDDYEAATGIAVRPEESHIVARRAARAEHPDRYEVRSAKGDWDPRVPKGFVHAYAERVCDGRPLVFRIPEQEYRPDEFLHPGTHEIAPNDLENRELLGRLGYRVVQDPDQKGMWVARYPDGGGSEVSFDSEDAAWEDAVRHAAETGTLRADEGEPASA